MQLPLIIALLGCTLVRASTQAPLFEIISERLQPHSSDFTSFQSDVSPRHSIRIKQQNATLCNTTVEQYTGWLDVGPHHLFFWYFKAEDPAPDQNVSPLALWLTGGPGSSSMAGMLGELGPCLVNEHGNGTEYNPYGWNKKTALIFVDQPAGVGFSYVDEGEAVPGDSFTSAADMRAFLQILVGQVFPEHLNAPLVITGESYAGHYLPALGAEIVSNNVLHPHQTQLRLKSLAIGNGFVSPMDSAYGYWETLCTTNPGVAEPVFNETICDIMATNMPRCMDVMKTCYDRPDPAICNTAAAVCWDGVYGFYDKDSMTGKPGGRNRFDITKPCEVGEDYCYASMARIEDYLNIPAVWAALGVPPSTARWNLTSEAVSMAFQHTSDLGLSLKSSIVYLLSNQIDILIYHGNLDVACNTAGSKRWTANLLWKGQPAFNAKYLKPWNSIVNGTERAAGKFKEVNIKMIEGSEKETRFTLLTIDGSGHMAPMDQPELSLDMISRWLAEESYD